MPCDQLVRKYTHLTSPANWGIESSRESIGHTMMCRTRWCKLINSAATYAMRKLNPRQLSILFRATAHSPLLSNKTSTNIYRLTQKSRSSSWVLLAHAIIHKLVYYLLGFTCCVYLSTILDQFHKSTKFTNLLPLHRHYVKQIDIVASHVMFNLWLFLYESSCTKYRIMK